MGAGGEDDIEVGMRLKNFQAVREVGVWTGTRKGEDYLTTREEERLEVMEKALVDMREKMKTMAETTETMAENMKTLNQSLRSLLGLKPLVEQLIPAVVGIRSANRGRELQKAQNESDEGKQNLVEKSTALATKMEKTEQFKTRDIMGPNKMALGKDLEGDTEEGENNRWVPFHGYEEKKYAINGGALLEINGIELEWAFKAEPHSETIISYPINHVKTVANCMGGSARLGFQEIERKISGMKVEERCIVHRGIFWDAGIDQRVGYFFKPRVEKWNEKRAHYPITLAAVIELSEKKTVDNGFFHSRLGELGLGLNGLLSRFQSISIGYSNHNIKTQLNNHLANHDVRGTTNCLSRLTWRNKGDNSRVVGRRTTQSHVFQWKQTEAGAEGTTCCEAQLLEGLVETKTRVLTSYSKL